MKRFHVHVHVTDLDRSVVFYSRLFGAEPARREGDYAKWMLDDPRVNFAISTRPGRQPGVNHLGFQADDEGELIELRDRADAALATDQGRLVDEGRVNCCYAQSDKHWVIDPQGIAWEQFHTLGAIPTFGGPTAPRRAGAAGDGATAASAACASSTAAGSAGACCGPAAGATETVTATTAAAAPATPARRATSGACCGA